MVEFLRKINPANPSHIAKLDFRTWAASWGGECLDWSESTTDEKGRGCWWEGQPPSLCHDVTDPVNGKRWRSQSTVEVHTDTALNLKAKLSTAHQGKRDHLLLLTNSLIAWEKRVFGWEHTTNTFHLQLDHFYSRPSQRYFSLSFQSNYKQFGGLMGVKLTLIHLRWDKKNDCTWPSDVHVGIWEYLGILIDQLHEF